MTPKSPKIAVLTTPNPQTLKFTWGQRLLEQGVINITTPEIAAAHPLTRSIFELPQVAGVMIGQDFMSVSKTEDADWNTVGLQQWMSLQETLVHLIQTYLTQNPNPQFQVLTHSSHPTSNNADDRVTQKIKQILDQEIRPAVARDGGDISFERFEDGVVYLHLKGACSGCPSSTMTLKMGIENRLKQSLPEVREVVSV